DPAAAPSRVSPERSAKIRDCDGRRRAKVRTFRIAAIPGDGIGREVIAAGVEALEACDRRDGGFQLAFDHFDWGSERYKKTGAFMPANGLDLVKGHDAILFGSAGAPDVPDHITLWGLRLAICQPFDQYANV